MPARVEQTSIGLDIGSSAVRAAEVALGRGGRRIKRYAQVGLPHGAVVDGEVVNPSAVSDALRRLWTEGGFSTRNVVLGVAGHRVFVRQAEVPALNEEDLRSALRFDSGELIPVPMESACFDFQVLDRGERADDEGRSMARILLVAAHRELVRSHMAALKGAGLKAAAIDAMPMALLRVVPPRPGTDGPGGGAVEAVVSIGAEMTTLAVRQDGTPRFIRSLAVGGSKLTAGIADALHVDVAVAERIKRDHRGSGQLAQVSKAVSSELRDLGEEVRATLDFFVAQGDGAPVDRVLVTGGASLMEGLVEVLAGETPVVIERVDPFAGLTLDDLGLAPDAIERARATAAGAVGLALWQVQEPSARLTMLPEEIAAARKSRQQMAVGGLAVAGVAGALVVASVAGLVAVHQARDQVHSAQHQESVLQSQVDALEVKTAPHAEMVSRQAALSSALRGEVDWVSVLNGLAGVVPAGLTVQSIAASSSAGATSSSSAAAPSTSTGSVTFQVQGSGGLAAVSTWLDDLGRDPQLSGTVVSGVSVASNGGQVSFQSTSNLTTQAETAQGKGAGQ